MCDTNFQKMEAERAGWQTRPSPRSDRSGDKLSGRGIGRSPPPSAGNLTPVASKTVVQGISRTLLEEVKFDNKTT